MYIGWGIQAKPHFEKYPYGSLCDEVHRACRDIQVKA